jgi:hypothetical protein
MLYASWISTSHPWQLSITLCVGVVSPEITMVRSGVFESEPERLHVAMGDVKGLHTVSREWAKARPAQVRAMFKKPRASLHSA